MSIQQVMMTGSNVIPDGDNVFSGTTSWTVPDDVTAIQGLLPNGIEAVRPSADGCLL